MATVVVSGRIDEAVRTRAQRFIDRAGCTAADVIKNVWESIAATGEVPKPVEEASGITARRQAFDDFMAFRASLPACPELAEMDDAAMRACVSERYA